MTIWARPVVELFIRINGVSTPITIPGALRGGASDINNLNQVVGVYSDATTQHGFLRQRNGALVYLINFPGAVSNTLNAINDLGWIDSATSKPPPAHDIFRLPRQPTAI